MSGEIRINFFECLLLIFIKESQPDDYRGISAFGPEARHPYIRELCQDFGEKCLFRTERLQR